MRREEGVKLEKVEVCMKLFLTNGERIKGTNIYKYKSNPSKLYFIDPYIEKVAK